MADMRLPGCKPPRRDDRTTSALYHPELLIGEIATKPRCHASHAPSIAMLSPLGRNARSPYAPSLPHRSLPVMIYRDGDDIDARAEQQALTATGLHWRQSTSDVVSRLARSTSDADLRQVSDAIFRMRRARRNCEAGWFGLTCQDYDAVARNRPGQAYTNETLRACPLIH